MTSTATAAVLPGPPALQIFRLLREFREDRLSFLANCARQYGDRVALRLGWRPAILLSHPDDIEVVVVNSRDFIKPWYLRNSTALGRGLIPSYGDFWLRQRRLMQPAFHRKRIATYGESMVAYAQRIAATWRDGETRDVHEDMMRVTMDVVIKTLFNAEPGDEAERVADALEFLFAASDDRMNSLLPLPESWPTPSNIKFNRAVREIDEIVYGFIRQRRSSADGQGDLLSMLLHARDESDGTGMTDQQLRDETVNLFLAGLDTTASALSWIWYLLSEHPAVEGRLIEELSAVLAGRAPTVDDVPQLKFTQMVIDEALRLYPPGFVMGREAIRDCAVNGLEVRAGTTLLVSQWVVHRDPRFFAEPDQFRPERWADGLAKRLPKYAYFPFGGGPHQCIGDTFALMELALVLPTIAQQFELKLVPGHPVTPSALFTLRPKEGVRMTIRRR
jgi:cytochrome P450